MKNKAYHYVVYDGLRDEYLAFENETLTTPLSQRAHRFALKVEASRKARLFALELGRSNPKLVRVMKVSEVK